MRFRGNERSNFIVHPRRENKQISVRSQFIICFLLAIIAIGLPLKSFAQLPLPPVAANAPDLQILVLSGISGSDVLNITYGEAVAPAQVQSDIASLAQRLDVDRGTAQITNSALPLSGMQSPIMTSVTLRGSGLAPTNGSPLPIAPILLALRRYHRLEISFIMPASYDYAGIRQFQNDDVKLSCSQNGATCIFNVVISNSNLLSLDLPNADVSSDQYESNRRLLALQTRRDNEQRTFAVIIIVALSILVGLIVYFSLSHQRRQTK